MLHLTRCWGLDGNSRTKAVPCKSHPGTVQWELELPNQRPHDTFIASQLAWSPKMTIHAEETRLCSRQKNLPDTLRANGKSEQLTKVSSLPYPQSIQPTQPGLKYHTSIDADDQASCMAHSASIFQKTFHNYSSRYLNSQTNLSNE